MPFVSKYHFPIYNAILRQVPNREIAQDLIQETWIKAFRDLSTFRGDAAFYSLLYQIAQNVCIDYFRRQHARQNIQPRSGRRHTYWHRHTPVPVNSWSRRNSEPSYVRRSNACPRCEKKYLRCATRKNSRSCTMHIGSSGTCCALLTKRTPYIGMETVKISEP